MAKYELSNQQVENLVALIMDANIKGSAAQTIVELLNVLGNPVKKGKRNDLHREHNDRQEHRTDQPKKNGNKSH